MGARSSGMNQTFHELGELFRQLGLDSDQASINQFIATHRPLPKGMALCEAPFWNASQAQFLREGLGQDADWAEVIDALGARLSG
jgi:hypothetical protein